MFNLDFIKTNFPKWDKKAIVSIGNSRQYKIIGCGERAFKVLVFEPQAELGGKAGWSQKFWNYKEIPKGSDAEQIIEKLESLM